MNFKLRSVLAIIAIGFGISAQAAIVFSEADLQGANHVGIFVADGSFDPEVARLKAFDLAQRLCAIRGLGPAREAQAKQSVRPMEVGTNAVRYQVLNLNNEFVSGLIPVPPMSRALSYVLGPAAYGHYELSRVECESSESSPQSRRPFRR